MVYLDPPFGTGTTRSARQRHSGTKARFQDSWTGVDDYIAWLRSIVEPASATLRDTGCLFLHCDWRVSHHIRVLLDDILGPENFRNEIIWHYRRWTAATASLQRLHQTIYYYASSAKHQPTVPLVPYSPTTNLDQIWQARTRNADNTAIYALDGQVPRNNGAKQGVPLGDVWEIPPLNPKARERVGYPTQKPLVLLERIVEIGSQPGNLIVDPCCGSGTTLVAAKLLGREAVGFDIEDRAIELTKQRLADPVRSSSRVLDGRDAFERRFASADYDDALVLMNAHTVQRNKVIHGYLSPIGLERIGFPATWSVPLALVEGDDAVVRNWTRALTRLVATKRSDAGLMLVRSRSAPPSVATSDLPAQVVIAPWPKDERELDIVRDAVTQWLDATTHARSA